MLVIIINQEFASGNITQSSIRVHSFISEASGLSQAHQDLRPAGLDPPQWKHLNWKPTGMLGILVSAGKKVVDRAARFPLLFLSNCAHTCLQSATCQAGSAENIAFQCHNTWSDDLRKSFLFSCSYDWSASPQNFLSYWNCLAALYSLWLLGQRMTQEHCTALLVNIRGWIPPMYLIPLHVMS